MKKYLKTVLIPICMVLILTCLTACANQANEGNTLVEYLDSKPSLQNEISDEEQNEISDSDGEQNEISDSDEEQLEAAYQEQETDPQQLKEYYDFILKTFRYMLAETENYNITYAPINFYVSLSILSEMTENEAEKELQDALGYADLNKHTTGLQNLVNSLKKRKQFNQEGIYGRLNLDTSFWLQDTLQYQEAVMNTIQKQYSLEVFEGDFKNSEFQKQMTNWVYEKTNHSLQPQFKDLMNTTEDNAFCIISTLDFFGEWSQPFKTEDTEKGIFFCDDGMQVECEFMSFEKPYAPYLAGDDYISTELSFVTGERMIFILPDETQAIRDFWKEDRLTDILSAWGNDDFSVAKMKFSVPKFNCSGKTDLKTIAEKMQVNQLFDPSSDAFVSFSNEPLYLMDIKQEASISIDEMGCSVASYTAVSGQSSAPEQTEEVDIFLNRPFYYILCKNEIPFLIGIVDNPAE